MPLDAHHRPDPKPAKHSNSYFCDAVAEFLAPMRGKGGVLRYSSAARHFLFWLDQNRIPLSSVNAPTVRRFANHTCSCPHYSAAQLRDPYYINLVRRFVRFLEDRGDIRRADDVHDINQHLARYADRLTHLGYSSWAHRVQFSAAEHFALWLRVSRLQWVDVDDALIERFAGHNCCCGLRRKNGRLAVSGLQKRRRGAQRFLAFLKEGGVVPVSPDDDNPEVVDTRLIAYRIWLERHCGMTGNTVERYLYEVARWQADLGADPASYEVTAVRNIVLNQPATRSRSSIRLTATVLRSYLRFLATRNECRPELYHAVPSVARRRLSTLPRYVSEAIIERIIASCGKATSADLRDRAIILLLARLGLRAGDSAFPISTGQMPLSVCMGKGEDRRTCHCHRTQAMPCSPTLNKPGHWWRKSGFSCGCKLHLRLSPHRHRFPTSCPACLRVAESRECRQERICFVILWQQDSCAMERAWKRWEPF